MTSVQQRAALQRRIWQIANDVRGSVDGWDFNLSVTTYVEAKDNREVIDIQQLNAEIQTTVGRINQLRADIDAIVAEIEGEEVEA